MYIEASWVLTSKRVWGIGIATISTFVPILAQYMGWNVDASQVTEIGVAGADLIGALGAFFGLALAFYGSLKAKGPVVFLDVDLPLKAS